MTRLPALAAGLTIVLWASAFVAIRQVHTQLSPGALTLGRLLVGSLALGIAVAIRPWVPPAGRHWPRLVVCGLLWFAGYNLALNAAERRLDAGTAALLVNVGPILIAVLAGVLLREGFPARLLVGLALAFLGVIVIGASTSQAGGHSDPRGVGVCLLAAVVYAIAVVTQKPLLAELPALQVTWLACAVGTVACLPFAPTLLRETGRAPGSAVLAMVYLGAFPTAVAFTTWAYALARSSAGRLGVTTYLVPPLAVLLSWLLLGETPAPLAYLGGALCLLGVAYSRRGTGGAVSVAPGVQRARRWQARGR